MGEEEVTTVITDEDGHWSESLVGENVERGEALKAFDTPDDYFAANDTALDWRRGLAGDDDKFMSTLERYSSAEDVGKAFREQRATISSGNLKADPGPDATEDDVKAYREANGIPLEAKGYMDNLPEGLVIGEDDKVIFEDFMGSLHAKNATPEVAHAAIEWYNGFAQREQDAISDLDSQQSTETNDLLREEWGGDYRANLNLVTGLISSTFGQEAADQLLNGRYGDGRAFMNDPNVLKGLAALARATNPVMEMGGDTHTAQESLNDEIGTLEKFMREHRTEYNNDEGGKATRLRKLYGIRIKQAAA
jgi:hypothetical protein